MIALPVHPITYLQGGCGHFLYKYHSARIIFDVSSGFYLWNINNTKADICKNDKVYF
jgi:hypothetical protein